MGNSSEKLSFKSAGRMAARALFPQGTPSEPCQNGRRLVLKLTGSAKPELDRIEFQGNATSNIEYRQRGGVDDAAKSFRTSPLTLALSMLFLDYLCLGVQTPPVSPVFEGGDGSPAATLGYALYNKNGKWGSLFVEQFNGQKMNRVEVLFQGRNWHGKPVGITRTVWINPEELPPDCIDIFWNNQPLTKPDRLRELAGIFRKAHGLPQPVELKFEKGEKSPAQPTSNVPKAEQVKSSPETSAGQPGLPGLQSTDKPGERPPFKIEFKSFSENQPKDAAGDILQEFTPKPESIPDIPPELFQIHNAEELEWDDSDGLINLGQPGSDADLWTIRNASEGVAVFGGIGSGKTSSSGYLISTEFLKMGYGGLVLTAKPDEAKRWLCRCERTGRMADVIHFHHGSGHKLNVLQYEIQRPGNRVSLPDDLVALIRTMNAVSSRGGRRNSGKDEFWTKAPDRLMKNLFEVFLLSGEPFSIAGFTRFINRCPDSPSIPWQGRGYFSEVIQKALENARKGSDEDRRMFGETMEYWVNSFPKMPDVTRGGIVASFEAITDILNGRGIHEILCTGTNFTPEMMLSGKIVIMDFPPKAGDQGGLMVQVAVKLLFQQAIERRADKNLSTARPVFLWEDEAHEFFSEHDVRFQPTARDCRAAHVMISQNLPNFYNQGHGQDAVDSVFSAMNTYFFHANGDRKTNVWASEKIGRVKRRYLSPSGLLKDLDHERGFLLNERKDDSKLAGGLSFTEENEPGMPPEDFGRLKPGGDGTSEAVVFWLSHQFAINAGRNFCKRAFKQEPREESKML